MATKPFDPNDIEALKRRIAELEAARQAKVSGPGAVAQGTGNALGECAAQVGSDNYATIITGTQIVNHYLAACSTALSQEAIARQVAAYLRWLCERMQSIEPRGIEPANDAPVIKFLPATACVPLRTRSMPRVGEPHEHVHARHRPNTRVDRDDEDRE